jgi:uncharacterized membrane protein required for colicin V production
MGLDLALGGLVLLNGIRGFFKGFILQALRLAGLVACVYAADPVRDAAKPHVAGLLPTIRPDLVDRLLWWVAAGASYFLLVGIATLLVKLSRRRALGEAELNYNDRFAGFFLGLLKGMAIAAALAAGVQAYALDYLKAVTWAVQQAEGSRALEWNSRYQPWAKVWSSPPVQHYVSHIRRMGIQAPGEAAAAAEPVAAANRPPQLAIPAEGVDLERLLHSVDEEMRKLDKPQ